MRISTAFAFENSLANLQRRQAQLSETQTQLTSGKRVRLASDDPAAAAAAERALAAGARAEAQLRAVAESRNAMQQTESALGDAGDLAQRARELMVGAGNASFSDAERATLAATLRGIREDLLAVANRSDGAGRYLFGGQGSDIKPLRDAPGGVVYEATTGQLNAAAGEVSPLSLDGGQVFLLAPDPSNPGTTISIFDTLDRAITELMTPGRTPAEVGQTVTLGLQGIDAAQGNLGRWRALAGEALNRADGMEGRLTQARVDAARDRSNAEDLDMVTAISAFQNQQSGYDAALKTYSLVQRMTLFDYLS
ncbi:MAG: flagellar hook-associated protein 3 [Leptothrix sp. (in: Bacteria)]|nr:flagellar hook-associated protein 3 [Leptothrix sp. (in: b-proteobacteria)]